MIIPRAIESLAREIIPLTAPRGDLATIAAAQQMANHLSPRTIRLYDRRNDEASLDEYAKVGI